MTQSTAVLPAPPTGRGRWVAAIVVLVLLTEQVSLGFTLIAPIFIGLATKFQTTQIIWVVTIFIVVGAVTAPLLGKLGDRYGKRKILVIAAFISVLGAVICALAPNFQVLLAGRALSGVGAVFLPLTFALIRDVFPEGFRNISISIATNGVGLVSIAGPFLAGFIIDNFSIEAVFWFLAGLSLVGAVGTIAIVPETPIRNPARVEAIGAIGLGIGLLLVMLGISQLQTWGLTSPLTYLTVGGGLVILLAWWQWEKRVKEPFIDTKVLSSRPLATVIFSYAFAGGAITVLASYLPTMLETPIELGAGYGFGLTATGVAQFLAIASIITVGSGFIVGFFSRKHGYRVFMIVGPLFTAAGAVGIAFCRTEAWMPIFFYCLVGLGTVVYAAGPGLLMVLSPTSERGATAGVSGAAYGAVGSIFAQIAGLVLGFNIGQIVGGYAVPTSAGFVYVFLIAAGMCIVAAGIALLIPRTEKQLQLSSSPAEIRTSVPAGAEL